MKYLMATYLMAIYKGCNDDNDGSGDRYHGRLNVSIANRDRVAFKGFHFE